jgi:hypothetical protein
MFHRLLYLTVATLALGISGSGCMVPAMRPMRATPGPALTVATGLMHGAKRVRDCYEDCEPASVTSVVTPVVDVRHGWMLAPHLGATAGLHLFGGQHVAKTTGWSSVAVAYAQMSWQSDLASLALGFDLGTNVIAPVVGVDVQPWGPGRWHPNLALYARRAQPFTSDDEPLTRDVRVRVPSWDTGVTLRVEPLMVQYSYYTQAEGRTEFPYYAEGSGQASAWHVILVGVDVPLGTLPPRR